jgi:hypothetical protein
MDKRTIWPRFAKVMRDLFTGPDGTTWAIGRFFSVPVLLVGLAIPIIALYRNQPIVMADVGILLAGVAGACLILIRGINNVDIDLSDPAKPRLIDRSKEPKP